MCVMADFLMDFAAGLVSKTIAAAVTFPLERAVTLLKVEGANPGLGAPAKPYARGLFGLGRVRRQAKRRRQGVAAAKGGRSESD